MSELTDFINLANGLLDRLETLLPARPAPPDWQAISFRWRKHGQYGQLEPLRYPHRIALDDLLCINSQRSTIERNTRQFLAGRSANNVLLWGSRGTGKSSLIKALFNTYAEQGLRLIEVDKDDLIDLPDILEPIRHRSEHFIIFCDDLSFEASESGYKTLKATLDGSLTAMPNNVLIYATSNRRHLLTEFHDDNRDTRMIDGELHPGEAIEEKISLSDRFGLWLSFYPFSQAQYLTIVWHWLESFNMIITDEETRAVCERAALQWALQRGSRSGRTAWQFARDWAGRFGIS
ncbi:ATP-binding protein [Thiospirillum jenense]|uniref:ATP-binding protein n=1 Tax=Thiospirillum jenense TaxID=1653858 RepID=A0A839HEW9_9GAMM|nr:ATP-binding protein [Thiospirillum jenense]MBB1126660.1 ATP-binding protein [Thiospirillum jenense]